MANKKSAGKKKSAAGAQTKKPAQSLSPDKTAVKPETAVSQPKAKADKKPAKKPNKAAKYFRDLRSEFKKVVWPSKKTVVNNTGVVLAVMIGATLVMWGLDSGFAAILKGLLSLAGA